MLSVPGVLAPSWSPEFGLELKPPEAFFSEWRGGAQRFDNGNTLITESETGRAFEVTADGEIVWEFWNPEIVDGKRKRIYRFRRVPPAAVEALLGSE